MSVIDAFNTFKSNLELPERRRDQAASAQKEIRLEVARHIYIKDSFLSGSYARHTKIDPLRDIDVILIHNEFRTEVGTGGNGIFPHQAIENLAGAVRQAYLSASIEKQSRSVNVKLPQHSFSFDLVPAWLRHPNGYWIPDTDTGGWLPTDPDAHARLLTNANDVSNLKLKPLIKMAKHWNRNNYDLLRSFHIELVCVDLVRSGKITPDISFQFGVATILVHLRTYAGMQMMDPTYGISRVDKRLSPDELTKLLSRIDSDSQHAIDALRVENEGNDNGAIEKWKHIFLSGFPR